MKVRNSATGEILDLPDNEAVQRHAAGEVDLPAGAAIPVQSPSGEIGTMDSARIADAMQAGYKLSTPEAVAAAEREARFGGVGGQAAAFAAGAGRTLTLGASDYAASLAGGREARDYLRGVRDENPTATTAGEITGMVAPALLTRGKSIEGVAAGEAGTISRIAGAMPGSLASRAGTIAEGLVARALPRAESALGRVGQRALASGVGSAVEGAFYGAGQVVSESALGDHELTAERLLAGAGHGALLGGVGGGVLAGGGAAIAEGAGAAGRGVLGIIRRAGTEATEAAGAGAMSGAPPEGGKLLDVLNWWTGRKAGSMREFATDVAEYEALRSTGAMTKEMRALQGKPDEIQTRAARMLIDEAPGTVGKSNIAQMTRPELYDATRSITKRITDEMDAVNQAADAVWKGTRKGGKTAIEITRKVDEIAERYGADVGGDAAAAVAGDFRRQVLDKLGRVERADRPGFFDVRDTSFSDLRKMRIDLDQRIERDAFGVPTKTLKNKALAEIRAEVESQIVKAADDISPELGARYVQAKKDYSAAEWLNRATQRGADADMANRRFGLGEQTAAIAGSVIGGSPVGGLVTGAVAAGLSRVVKDRASQIASGVADAYARNNVSILGAIERAAGLAESRTSTAVSKYVKRLTTGEIPKPSARAVVRAAQPAESARQRYESRMAEVRRMQADPAYMAARVAERTGGMSQAAPRTYASLVQRLAAINEFLAHNSKPTTNVGGSLLGHMQPRKPTDAEVAAFGRAVDVIDRGPVAVLEAMDRRALTPEHVEALKVSAPKSFDEIRGKLIEGLASAQRLPPYVDRIQLGILFQFAADETMRPDFVAAIQGTYAAGEATPARPSPRPIKVADAAESRTERMES